MRMNAAFIRADSPAIRTSEAGRGSLHAGNNGLREPSHQHRDLADLALKAKTRGGSRSQIAVLGLKVASQIQTGAKGSARATQDDDAGLWTFRKTRQAFPQFIDQDAVHGVQGFGPIQRQPS